jgi:hypothetical protein
MPYRHRWSAYWLPRLGRRVLPALLALVPLGIAGCATVGPQSIVAGRGAYAEVINRTEDEQILNAMVRMRYDETFGLMSVSSVTAHLRFSAQAGANVGIGNSNAYNGNLVPLSVGVAYEENPTISYAPLSGEDFMQSMLSPISIKEWLLIATPNRHPDKVFTLAVRRINGLRNPLLTEQPAAPEFTRVAELYGQLRSAAVLDYVLTPAISEAEFFWDIHDYQPDHSAEVREFLDLLGITAQADGAPVRLPLRQAVGRSANAIHLQTRSAYEVLRLFGAGIEVPPLHLTAGIVEPAAETNLRLITIRSSTQPPDDASVRTRFRDQWFYIAANDTVSKRVFSLLRILIAMRLSDAGAKLRAPVLTMPVN